MLLYRNSNTDPSLNLAIEEWLLNESKENCFMLWQNRPSIIVGRNQNTSAEINQEFVASNQLPVVRRLSGGGAVYHDLGNINFTFIAHGSKDILNFQHFAEPVIQVLRRLGVNAEFSGRNDMLIDGRKFSGNAQYIQGDKVLHHGTLLFESDLTVLEKALKVDPGKYESKGVKSVASRVTNIAPHLAQHCTAELFIEVLYSHVREMFPGATFASLSEKDYLRAQDLVRTRYENWNWNFGKSMAYNFRNSIRAANGYLECQLLINNGRIIQAKIYGDFFGAKPIEELERLLVGVPHGYNAICHAWKDITLGDYFAGIDRNIVLRAFI